MKVAYWIVVVLLSALYLYAGARKVSQTKEQLAPMMAWVDTMPLFMVRAIGLIEIVGVVGLILPAATGVAPGLSLLAAVGFVVLQALATGVHLSRGEGVKGIPINIVLITLAGVAVWLATAF